MVDHDADCAHLVVLHGAIDGVGHDVLSVKLAIIPEDLRLFGPIEDRKLLLEVLAVLVGQQDPNRVAIKRQERHHVLPV